MEFSDDARNNRNCYEIPGVMFCKVGTRIRVNLSDLDGKKDGAHKNYMFVDLSGKKIHRQMACCEIWTKLDEKLDLLANRASRIFNENFTRSVMGWWVAGGLASPAVSASIATIASAVDASARNWT